MRPPGARGLIRLLFTLRLRLGVGEAGVVQSLVLTSLFFNGVCDPVWSHDLDPGMFQCTLVLHPSGLLHH